jgi:Ran GTPase-activating protein (RanGAP) involved in mRNA processing and transport
MANLCDKNSSLNFIQLDKNQHLNKINNFILRLSHVQSLLHLSLRECKIDDKSLEYIQPEIIKSSSLRSLNLAKNQLTDKGADSIRIIITECSTLQELSISHNSLSQEGFYIIFKAFEVTRRAKTQSIYGPNPDFNNSNNNNINNNKPMS